MKKKYLLFCFSPLLLSSCNKNEKSAINEAVKNALDSVNSTKKNDSIVNYTPIEKENKSSPIVIDSGEEWLKSLFVNKQFPDENKVCTKRFLEYMSDKGSIWGPSNYSEEEAVVAEKVFRKKYGGIYKILEDENWLFGRGNGGEDKVQKFKISKISELNYTVFIDFGDNVKTNNNVILVKSGDSYKIDFCETKFIE